MSRLGLSVFLHHPIPSFSIRILVRWSSIFESVFFDVRTQMVSTSKRVTYVMGNHEIEQNVLQIIDSMLASFIYLFQYCLLLTQGFELSK